MPINSDEPNKWKTDIAQSVDYYNRWFLRFAPKTYRATREETAQKVESALVRTKNLADISPSILRTEPGVLSILRMATAPPIARDRLIGLAGVSSNLVKSMEIEERIPPQMAPQTIVSDLKKIATVIRRLADRDIVSWIDSPKTPVKQDVRRAATIIADRLCGTVADPIIRNAQERRQLKKIKAWLEKRGYRNIPPRHGLKIHELPNGTFSFRFNVPVKQADRANAVNIPVDVVIMPNKAKPGSIPILVEAKSAGDFTNTNKRRKEEAAKVVQLRVTYGEGVQFILFLCGYFDSGYLGYEAAEGIDWVWEHRIDDLKRLGV